MQKITPRDAENIAKSTQWIEGKIHEGQIEDKVSAKISELKSKYATKEDFDSFEMSEKEMKLKEEANRLFIDFGSSEKIPRGELLDMGYSLDEIAFIIIAVEDFERKRDQQRLEDNKKGGNI